MRLALAAAAVSVLAVSVPSIASAQGVVIEERGGPDVVVREREERVIVREPRERIVEEEGERVARRAPDSVRRYVIQERRPSVAYERKVVVGDVLPEEVEVHSVPDSDYEYAVLNGRRVIVDDGRRVIEEMD